MSVEAKPLPFAARRVALAAAFCALSAAPLATWALGLGRLNVQSALGEPLRAEIEITSITAEEQASLQARVASPETYRAAGVDYNAVLGATSVSLGKRSDGRQVLRLSSDRAVTEPFVDAILDLGWSSGRLVREYTLLFDPPAPKALQREPVLTAPAMDTPAPAPRAPVPAVVAPAPAPVAKPRPAPAPAPVASAPAKAAPAPAPAAAAAPAPAPASAPVASAPRAAGSDSVKVRNGDTLSAIAERTLRPGVSLDQMVVGLYRNNPDAFQGNNMNRLKAGVVLNVPDADKAQSVSPQEARQVINAQSSDFSAYRERLAAGVAEAAPKPQERQAKGKVEAEVQDRKAAAAPSPDKLTLSKGSVQSGPGVEDKLAKERAQKDSGTRVSELSKNLDDLRKLKEAAAAASKAAPAKPAPAPAPAPAPVAKPAPAPAPVAASKPEPKPAPVAPSAPAVVASAPAPVPSSPDVPASATATESVTVASAPSAAEPASVPAPTIPRPVQIPVEPVPAEEPGFFQSVDPTLLAGAGVLVAGLAGAGLYLRSRRRPDSAETSFLESRLQPDSFFGASGGQRVDTRDATGGPSSMSYSLSQLDAIGDVDPVAEADVYLAYGRDLQAEEILKEALRSTPDRLAIRTKLLEVYAKRRDTKGFEQLAVQLFGLTGGRGDDWARTQEMGLSIDPENPLYQPGGQPALGAVGTPEPVEALGASTVPVSVMPGLASSFDAPITAQPYEPEPVQPDLSITPEPADLPAAAAAEDDGIDLDISAPAPLDAVAGEPVAEVAEAPEFPAASELPDLPDLPDLPAVADVSDAADMTLELPEVSLPEVEFPEAPAVADTAPLDALPELPEVSEATELAESAPGDAGLDFDLSSISLDLDEPASAADAPVADAADLAIDIADDPMARKLDLAEEFRQIGDVDGARELLQEVIASASDDALKGKAQSMLDNLG
jgi:pilus assembly protein FimV